MGYLVLPIVYGQQSIAEFEEDLRNNLYRIWNRMSSGSYMPPPVRRELLSILVYERLIKRRLC
jgi:hypothetical protein